MAHLRRGYWHIKIGELKDLEHTVCKISNSIVFDIGEDRIEASKKI